MRYHVFGWALVMSSAVTIGCGGPVDSDAFTLTPSRVTAAERTALPVLVTESLFHAGAIAERTVTVDCSWSGDMASIPTLTSVTPAVTGLMPGTSGPFSFTYDYERDTRQQHQLSLTCGGASASRLECAARLSAGADTSGMEVTTMPATSDVVCTPGDADAGLDAGPSPGTDAGMPPPPTDAGGGTDAGGRVTLPSFTVVTGTAHVQPSGCVTPETGGTLELFLDTPLTLGVPLRIELDLVMPGTADAHARMTPFATRGFADAFFVQLYVLGGGASADERSYSVDVTEHGGTPTSVTTTGPSRTTLRADVDPASTCGSIVNGGTESGSNCQPLSVARPGDQLLILLTGTSELCGVRVETR